jgi:hypothetical protein
MLLGLAFFGGLTVLHTIDALRQRRDCVLASGGEKGEEVVGIVEHFHPMAATGHECEEFFVGTAHFCFSEWEGGCHFHKTAAYGGPLKEGLRVRIRHVEGRIMRLEIAR